MSEQSCKNLAIKVEGVSKEYRLGVLNHSTLYEDIQSWWAALTGKEDPNSLLGRSSRPGGAGRKEGRKTFLAIDNVSFEVAAGEALGIIGRNGAGKSTLLKLLTRITAPSAGVIRYRGRIASLLEVGTGFHPELTGRENIFLNGAILGMRRHEVERRFDEIVEFAGIGRFIDTPVKRYSSGMYVRLAFAVAAHLDAEILLVDEVLAVGDAEFQRRCLGKMQDVTRSTGRTVLFVSHSMAAIRQLCSRALLLEEGRLIAHGDVEETVRMYEERILSFEKEGTSLLERPRQKGNGKLLFSKVELLDLDGRPVSTPVSGMTLRIRLYYESYSEELPVRYFSIWIESSRGVLTFMDTRMTRSEEGFIVHGSGWVECIIPKVPFTKGRYTLGIYAESVEGLLDYVPEAAVLDVENGDFFGNGLQGRVLRQDYPFLIEHLWKLSGD